LKKATEGLVDFATAEKWMIKRKIRMDYVNSTIIFAPSAKEVSAAASIEQPLFAMASVLSTEMGKVGGSSGKAATAVGTAAVAAPSRAQLHRRALFSQFKDLLGEETRRLEERRMEIERRADEAAQQSLAKADAQRRADAIKARMDADNEKKRLAEDRERRQREAAETKKRELDTKKMLELINDMKKLYPDRVSDLRVGETVLDGITQASIEDLVAKGALDLDMVVGTKQNIIQKDRQAKITARKLEYKRVDHLARAVREADIREIPMKAFEKKIQEE